MVSEELIQFLFSQFFQTFQSAIFPKTKLFGRAKGVLPADD
jgi:hypothetical protein